MSSQKAERQLKELRRLMPWCWDSRVEEHPPGEKAMHDFQDVLTNQLDQPRRRVKQQTPAAEPARAGPAPREDGRSSQRRAGEQRSNKRVSPGQGPLEERSGPRSNPKLARVEPPAAKATPGPTAHAPTGSGAAAREPPVQATPAVARPQPRGSPAAPGSALEMTPAQVPGSRMSTDTRPPSTCLPGSRHQAAITDYQLMPTPAPPSAGVAPQHSQHRLPRSVAQPRPGAAQPQAAQPTPAAAAVAEGPTQNACPNSAAPLSQAQQRQQQQQRQQLGAALIAAQQQQGASGAQGGRGAAPPAVAARPPAGPPQSAAQQPAASASAAMQLTYAAALTRGLPGMAPPCTLPPPQPITAPQPPQLPLAPAVARPSQLPPLVAVPEEAGPTCGAGEEEEEEEVSPQQAMVLSALARLPALPPVTSAQDQAPLSLFQPPGPCVPKPTAALQSLLAALHPEGGADAEAAGARSPSCSPPAACPPLFKPNASSPGEGPLPAGRAGKGAGGRTNLPMLPPKSQPQRKGRSGAKGGGSISPPAEVFAPAAAPRPPRAPAAAAVPVVLSAWKQQQQAAASRGLHSRERALVGALRDGCRMRSGVARPKGGAPRLQKQAAAKPAAMGEALFRALELLSV